MTTSTLPRTGFAPGDVIAYDIDTGHFGNHCREALAVVAADGQAFDTFWDGGTEAHRLTATEMASATVQFNLADYDELDRYSRSSEATWVTYAPEDRALVTSQHGLISRYFVRKDAQPCLATQIENAAAKVREAEGGVESAHRRLEWAREDLAALTQQQQQQAQQVGTGADRG